MSTDDQIIEKLQLASKLMQENASFDKALDIFDQILKEKEEPINNSNVEKFEGAIQGIRGECLFSLNRMDEAIAATEIAMANSTESSDDEGTVSLYINLYEIYRYTSENQKAIKACEEIAALFAKIGDEKSKVNYEKQYEVLKKGEPLCRVIAVLDGVNHEVDELVNMEKGKSQIQFQFSYMRNRLSLPPSRHFERLGREVFIAGEYEKATELLLKSIEADKFNPGPHYELGLVYIHLTQYEKALEQFNIVEQLAPGWFYNRHYIWITKAMINQDFNDNVFKLIYLLQEGNLTPQQRIAACEKAITQNGLQSPPLFFHLGVGYQQVKNIEYAKAAFKTVLIKESDDDLRTRALFNLAIIESDPEEKAKHLIECMQLSGNLTTAAIAAFSSNI